MAELKIPAFDAPAFLAEAGLGRRIVQLKPKETFFSQGDLADSLFYLQRGRAKADSSFEKWQRSHHHTSLYGRLHWRGVAGDRGWAAHDNCHGHHRL
jgi:hypothetical protein